MLSGQGKIRELEYLLHGHIEAELSDVRVLVSLAHPWNRRMSVPYMVIVFLASASKSNDSNNVCLVDLCEIRGRV